MTDITKIFPDEIIMHIFVQVNNIHDLFSLRCTSRRFRNLMETEWQPFLCKLVRRALRTHLSPGFSVGTFCRVLHETGSFLSGSFVLRALLGGKKSPTWQAHDLDIFVFTKEASQRLDLLLKGLYNRGEPEDKYTYNPKLYPFNSTCVEYISKKEQAYETLRIQCIKVGKKFPTSRSIVEEFDFSCCTNGFNGKDKVTIPDLYAVNHLLLRPSKKPRVESPLPIRVQKYLQRGFQLDIRTDYAQHIIRWFAALRSAVLYKRTNIGIERFVISCESVIFDMEPGKVAEILHWICNKESKYECEVVDEHYIAPISEACCSYVAHGAPREEGFFISIGATADHLQFFKKFT